MRANARRLRDLDEEAVGRALLRFLVVDEGEWAVLYRTRGGVAAVTHVDEQTSEFGEAPELQQLAALLPQTVQRPSAQASRRAARAVDELLVLAGPGLGVLVQDQSDSTQDHWEVSVVARDGDLFEILATNSYTVSEFSHPTFDWGEFASTIESTVEAYLRPSRPRVLQPNYRTYPKEPDEELFDEWQKLVNMTASELQSFLKTGPGKRAGLSKSEAADQNIESGQRSAEKLLEMIPKGTSFRRAEKEWKPEHWSWARRQRAFIKRKRAQLKSQKLDLYEDDGAPTRMLTSLLVWGHDPERFDSGKTTKLLSKPSQFRENRLVQVDDALVERVLQELTRQILERLDSPDVASFTGKLSEKPGLLHTLASTTVQLEDDDIPIKITVVAEPGAHGANFNVENRTITLFVSADLTPRMLRESLLSQRYELTKLRRNLRHELVHAHDRQIKSLAESFAAVEEERASRAQRRTVRDRTRRSRYGSRAEYLDEPAERKAFADEVARELRKNLLAMRHRRRAEWDSLSHDYVMRQALARIDRFVELEHHLPERSMQRVLRDLYQSVMDDPLLAEKMPKQTGAHLPNATPADPELYERTKRDVKARVTKWPSAYASGQLVQEYKRRGGEYVDNGGGLGEWFDEDWVALSPVSKTLKSGRRVRAGDIVGPCAQSDDPDWRELTRGGQDPLKCVPRERAEAMSRSERASAARRKLAAERAASDSKTPTRVATLTSNAAEEPVFAVFAVARAGAGDQLAATTRPREPGRVGLPGGKVDPGESPVDALFREAREEGWELLGEPRLVHEDSVEGRRVQWYAVDEARKLSRFKEQHRLRPVAVARDEVAESGYGNEWLKGWRSNPGWASATRRATSRRPPIKQMKA